VKDAIPITSYRGESYFYRSRDWAQELAIFLDTEARAATPRLSPERLGYYRRLANADNAHRALAAAQLEAAGWLRESENGA
jgi:hypothetical protein